MTYYREKLDGKILASVEYGQRLLFSDEFPSEDQPDFNDVSVTIMSDDLDQLQTYFANLEKDAIEVIVLF